LRDTATQKVRVGRARDEEALIRQAATRFDEIGLAWHAAETRTLLG
jgi:hypothetical protein